MARAKIILDRVTELPPVCVCCGQPATRERQQEFRLDGALSAAVFAASLLASGLAWTERGVTLTLPVCEYHRRRGRRSTQTLIRGMALTVGLGAAAYVASLFGGPASSYLSVAAMIAFIVTLVVGMHEVDDGLGVRSLQGDSLTLGGVSQKFAEAVAAVDQYQPLLARPEQKAELAGIAYDCWARHLAHKKKWQAALDKYKEGWAAGADKDHLTKNAIATIDEWASLVIEAKQWDEAIRIYEIGLKDYFPGNSHLQHNREYCEKMRAKSR